MTPEELSDDYTSISRLNEVKHIIEKKDQELEQEKKKANETEAILKKEMQNVQE